MQRGAFAFTDGVGPIRVSQHLEWLVVRHQRIDELGHTLVMHVVIRRAMDELKLAFQIFSERNRRTVFIALLVIVRQAHVAFLINGVVEQLIRHGRDRDARVIQIGIPKERVEGH